MSYSIFLKNNNGKMDDDNLFIFPFSGHRTFNQFWKGMIDKFNLEMIALFEGSVTLDDIMYEDFLKELNIVRIYLESLPDNENNDKGELERIYFVLETLNEKKDKYKYITIG